MSEESDVSIHKFVIDFTGAPINIVIGPTLIDALGAIDPEMAETEGSGTKGMTITGDEEGFCYMLFPDNSDINTIVHEAVHCVSYIIDYFDLPSGPENDELMAYMMGYVVDCIHRAIDERKQMRKDKKAKKVKNEKGNKVIN